MPNLLQISTESHTFAENTKSISFMAQPAESNEIFNPAQLHILELLKYCKTQESLDELDNIISKFYDEKLQAEADRLSNEGVLNNEAIENLLNQHLRTPYRQDS